MPTQEVCKRAAQSDERQLSFPLWTSTERMTEAGIARQRNQQADFFEAFRTQYEQYNEQYHVSQDMEAAGDRAMAESPANIGGRSASDDGASR
ncbi:unnamed protein product, partial [Chrysoparadoxa australica]